MLTHVEHLPNKINHTVRVGWVRRHAVTQRNGSVSQTSPFSDGLGLKLKHVVGLRLRLTQPTLALQTDWQREENRLEKARIGHAPDEVILSIHQIKTAIGNSMAELKQDIDDHIDRHPDLKHDIELLKTIPGVGDVVAPRMALLYRSRRFQSAAQMAAFLGLVPKERTSGQYRGKVRLSKQGNSQFRALLYMPAVVAKRCNPDIKASCERLLAKGKSQMQAIGTAMRRLVHICFGVLKHQAVYQVQTVKV